MNKVLTVVKIALPILILLAGNLHAQSQPLSLADVIKQSAREIEETLPQGSKVAVLNFNSPSKTFSEYVIEELGGELIEGRKITVVDRNNIDAILREMEFQSSGHVSDASIQQIGKMIGTQAIITGSFSDVGTNYRFRTRLINIETATVQRQITFELPRDEKQVAFLLGGERPKVEKIEKVKVRKRDHYFAARGMLTAIDMKQGLFGGGDLEYGQIWGDGWFLGIDGGIGFNFTSNDYSGVCGNMGLNLGYTHELSSSWQIAYGGSVGYWHGEYGKRIYNNNHSGTYIGYSEVAAFRRQFFYDVKVVPRFLLKIK